VPDQVKMLSSLYFFSPLCKTILATCSWLTSAWVEMQLLPSVPIVSVVRILLVRQRRAREKTGLM
jgi:hypothetical protein